MKVLSKLKHFMNYSDGQCNSRNKAIVLYLNKKGMPGQITVSMGKLWMNIFTECLIYEKLDDKPPRIWVNLAMME